MRTIPLTRGKVAIVDECDYDALSQFTWHVSSHGYAKRNSPRRQQGPCCIYMHREIVGPLPDMRVDHVNFNTLDNRRSNLRPATQGQNIAHSFAPKHNSSGVKGVSFCKKTKRWRAQIVVKKKYHHLGRFDSLEDASKAYVVAARAMLGEFCAF